MDRKQFSIEISIFVTSVLLVLIASSVAAAQEIGCVKWQFSADGGVHQSVVIGASGNVHVCAEDGLLNTLAPSGELLWSYDAGSEITSSPTVGPDGAVYIGCRNGYLHVIDQFGIGRLLTGSGTTLITASGSMIYSAVAVSDDGDVYFGSTGGKLYGAFSNGSPPWMFTLLPIGQINDSILASPAIGIDGTIYVGGLYSPKLYAFDENLIEQGFLKWTANLPADGGLFVSPVVAADGTILVIQNQSSVLITIDPVDGTVIRQTDLAGASFDSWLPGDFHDNYLTSQCFTEPVIGGDGTIYISMDDPYLRAINPDGSIKWVARLGMVGGFSLTVTDNDLIYAACDDGTLYVVDTDGIEVSRFDGSKYLSFPVIAPDGTIYVSDSDKTLWAINSTSCDDGRSELHRLEDVSGDGIVSLADFSIIVAGWMDCTDPAVGSGCGYYSVETRYLRGDVDRDLYVNFTDLMRIVDNWLNDK